MGYTLGVGHVGYRYCNRHLAASSLGVCVYTCGRVITYLQHGVSKVEHLDADVDTQEVVAIETSPKQTAVGC